MSALAEDGNPAVQMVLPDGRSAAQSPQSSFENLPALEKLHAKQDPRLVGDRDQANNSGSFGEKTARRIDWLEETV